MKTGMIFLILAISGLVLICTISILFAAGISSHDLFLQLLVAGTLLWFAGIIIARRTGRNRVSSEDPDEYDN
jgi:Sec-independent protein secretion pathway component TatC